MNRTFSISAMAVAARDAVRRLGVGGRLAIIVAVLALAATALGLPGLVSALLARSVKVEAVAPDDPKRAQELADAMDSYVKQFDGRSLFFVPSAPPPPPPAPVINAEATPTAPPPPSRYGGPLLIAMVNETAWFDDGRRLKAGADADGDLRVKNLEAPWAALVEWKGVEFRVSLFDRDRVVVPPPADPPKPAEASASKPPEPQDPPGPAPAQPPPASPPPGGTEQSQ